MKKEVLITMAAAALFAGCSDNKLGSSNTTAKDPKVASEFNDLPPAVRELHEMGWDSYLKNLRGAAEEGTAEVERWPMPTPPG